MKLLKPQKKMGRPRLEETEKRVFIGAFIKPHIKERVETFSIKEKKTFSLSIEEILRRFFYGPSDL